MESVIFFVFLIVASFLFAKVEIAIEGPNGWAANLPTWKKTGDHILSRLFWGGRPATGYHLWITLFILFLIHLVFIFLPWTLLIELKLISFIILFFTLEDFLWFILNPAFGLKNFRKEKIWWHEKRWFWIAPIEYFFALPIGLIIYYLTL